MSFPADLTGEVIKDSFSKNLDKIEIERLRNIIRAEKPESTLLRLNEKDLLEDTGITKDHHLTVAGMLLVGKEDAIEKYVPVNEVIYLHMKNDINYDKRMDYKRGILYILEDVYRSIDLYNKITTVKVGLFLFQVDKNRVGE